MIANAAKASLVGNATSGAHSRNSTVAASTARIRRIKPAYGPCSASGACTWSHGAPLPGGGQANGSNGPALGAAVTVAGLPGWEVVNGRFGSPQAAPRRAVATRSSATERHRLRVRVMCAEA